MFFFKGSVANDLMLSYLRLLPKLNFGQLPEKENLATGLASIGYSLGEYLQ
jgi:hypothetical protein